MHSSRLVVDTCAPDLCWLILVTAWRRIKETRNHWNLTCKYVVHHRTKNQNISKYVWSHHLQMFRSSHLDAEMVHPLGSSTARSAPGSASPQEKHNSKHLEIDLIGSDSRATWKDKTSGTMNRCEMLWALEKQTLVTTTCIGLFQQDGAQDITKCTGPEFKWGFCRLPIRTRPLKWFILTRNKSTGLTWRSTTITC